jgi:hypothetical protein
MTASGHVNLFGIEWVESKRLVLNQLRVEILWPVNCEPHDSAWTSD